ncbi:hypothetical protein RvY_12180 [Ramazzottius varieornatus]|uniref:G-protein coupled receptors family 1 profile domain-containing protein n=1 Tax=Ramazzottius varieornatus TaxID=947166 RepID=A0A1D1VIM6_RAMVA|nr:hypothetical protein RvY_12180 [Ramazzottius varieornatus]
MGSNRCVNLNLAIPKLFYVRIFQRHGGHAAGENLKAIPTFATVPPFGGCLYNPNADALFRLSHGVLGVYLPFAVTGTAYLTIFVEIFRSRLVTGQKLTASMKRRVSIAQMLFAAFVWFCLTYLPQPILTASFKDVYLQHPVSYFLVRLALSFGASINPVSITYFG